MTIRTPKDSYAFDTSRREMAASARSSTTSADERALERRGYILGGKIGQGSYAKVRSCTYLVDGRKEILACKIIDRSKAPSDFLRKFFPRELDIITWLDHPHVIRVHSILERQDRVFIFMQYCENGDLLDYVRDHGVIKEPQARVWFKQMYAGLNYLHSRNIAHRDLKCENVLLTRHWNVKLGDFGFARAVIDQDGRRVLSETYCGSAAYAAPEVVRGQPYNPKMSDIWSLGVILFIMVNAAMPFDDSNLKKMLKDQQSRNWHLRSKVKDKLSAEIKHILEHLMEPDVTKRITIDMIATHAWIANSMSLGHPNGRERSVGARHSPLYRSLHKGDEGSPHAVRSPKHTSLGASLRDDHHHTTSLRGRMDSYLDIPGNVGRRQPRPSPHRPHRYSAAPSSPTSKPFFADAVFSRNTTSATGGGSKKASKRPSPLLSADSLEGSASSFDDDDGGVMDDVADVLFDDARRGDGGGSGSSDDDDDDSSEILDPMDVGRKLQMFSRT